MSSFERFKKIEEMAVGYMNEIDIAEKIYLAFCEQHKKTFASFYEKLSFQAPEVANKLIPVPEWNSLSNDLKECWIATALEAINILRN